MRHEPEKIAYSSTKSTLIFTESNNATSAPNSINASVVINNNNNNIVERSAGGEKRKIEEVDEKEIVLQKEIKKKKIRVCRRKAVVVNGCETFLQKNIDIEKNKLKKSKKPAAVNELLKIVNDTTKKCLKNDSSNNKIITNKRKNTTNKCTSSHHQIINIIEKNVTEFSPINNRQSSQLQELPETRSQQEGALMESTLLSEVGDLVSCIGIGGGVTPGVPVINPTTTQPNSSVTRRRAHYFKKIAQKYQQQQQFAEPAVDYISSQHIASNTCCKSMQNQIIGSFYCIDECGDIMKRKIKQQPYFNVSKKKLKETISSSSASNKSRIVHHHQVSEAKQKK